MSQIFVLIEFITRILFVCCEYNDLTESNGAYKHVLKLSGVSRLGSLNWVNFFKVFHTVEVHEK